VIRQWVCCRLGDNGGADDLHDYSGESLARLVPAARDLRLDTTGISRPSPHRAL